MGALELLAIIFVVLKVTGTIAWSWWFVMSPLIVAVILYIFIISLFGTVFITMMKQSLKNLKK